MQGRCVPTSPSVRSTCRDKRPRAQRRDHPLHSRDPHTHRSHQITRHRRRSRHPGRQQRRSAERGWPRPQDSGRARVPGNAGQVLVLTKEQPAVAVGIGEPGTADAARLRDAAAAFARAVPRYSSLGTDLADTPGVPSEAAGQAVTEGILLARYTYDELKSKPSTIPLTSVNLTASSRTTESVRNGAERGQIFAEAAMLARDLANSPPAYLTATRMADVASRIAKDTGLKVEVFDKEALMRMGCGGLLGVNAGSTEPPRMSSSPTRPTAEGAPNAPRTSRWSAKASCTTPAA